VNQKLGFINFVLVIFFGGIKTSYLFPKVLGGDVIVGNDFI